MLLSIGYSSCHWCHVMAHESFEDEKIAAVMNANYINIKVDMEERPDIDKIYMNFVQLSTGSGGWPLTVFMTPDQKPFFGGTYFPPEPRFNMPGFEQILVSVADAYRNKRDEVLVTAEQVIAELGKGPEAMSTEGDDKELLQNAFQAFLRGFDRVNGGFGAAPKFPAPMALEFLLRYFKRTGEETALEMVKHTCNQMAQGGIFDQLGGGFHRYSVDEVWLVPHFEKMLYDNAQMARIYLQLYKITGDEYYRSILERTLEYVEREMLDQQGGFYSAQDADSEGVEGKFFVWTPEQVREVLDEESASVFCEIFDVTEEGNFEGNSIPNFRRSVTAVAESLDIEVERVKHILNTSVTQLFEAREKRVKPFRDEKVLTAWNGLMLATFADAAGSLNDEYFLNIAVKNADFLLEELVVGDKLKRSWKDGVSKIDAYLEDYAFLADGLFELYRVTGTEKYLDASKDFADTIIDRFYDEEKKGFFFTASDHEELLVRSKDFLDNAIPSGNSAAFDVLSKLARLTGNGVYENIVNESLAVIRDQIEKYPSAFGRTLSTLEFRESAGFEIVVMGQKGNSLSRLVNSMYLPGSIVIHSEEESELEILKGRSAIDGNPTAFLCRNFTCEAPIQDAEELKAVLLSRSE